MAPTRSTDPRKGYARPQKAEQTAAASDVREAIPSAEAYYSDNADSYAGISTNIQTVKSENSDTGYCISAKVGSSWAHVVGPGGQVQSDGQAAADPCP